MASVHGWAGNTPALEVLVVEDEAPIRELVQEFLEHSGYRVTFALDGKEGLRLFFTRQPDLVLLDVMLPGMDGWQLLERIREVSEVPVIMVTALGQERDKVRGLRGGADDYLVKPFGGAELMARVEAVLRRVHTPHDQLHEQEAVYQDAVLHVDFEHHHVYRRGQEVRLSPTEFRLLGALVRNPGHVLSPERLLDLAWGSGEGGAENVRVYIGYLRRKLEDDPAKPALIETIREFGYRYTPPGERT